MRSHIVLDIRVSPNDPVPLVFRYRRTAAVGAAFSLPCVPPGVGKLHLGISGGNTLYAPCGHPDAEAWMAGT